MDSTPSYSALYESIKNHLNRYSSALAKRVLLIVWPGLLYITVYSFLNEFEISEESFLFRIMLYIGIFFLPFALVYIFALTHLFSFEKVLWIDSYHDKARLGLKGSFRVAKKLFWASFVFRLYLFFRYYFFPLAAFLFLAIVAIIIPGENENYRYNPFLWIAGAIFLGPIILYIYFYYLKIKLRYVWFLYLDLYGNQGFFYRNIFSEMRLLNAVGKSEIFQKSLVVSLGADVVQSVVGFSLGAMFHGMMGGSGRAGRVIAGTVSAYANEVTAQASSLAKLAANYILYLYSREQLYGESSIRNEKVYCLRNSNRDSQVDTSGFIPHS